MIGGLAGAKFLGGFAIVILWIILTQTQKAMARHVRKKNALTLSSHIQEKRLTQQQADRAKARYRKSWDRAGKKILNKHNNIN
jgi:hypothetical protein